MQEMIRTGMIISGGHIDQDFALAFLKHNAPDVFGRQSESGEQASRGTRPTYVIAADAGLLFCRDHQIMPDAIVGDFDSADRSLCEQYVSSSGAQGPLVKLYKPEKDWTDTELAAELALSEGLKEAFLLGGTGTRLDHVLGNIQVLDRMLDLGLAITMVDEHNRITVHNADFAIRREAQWGKYVSFIPWGGEVSGLTLKGFQYPLQDHTMRVQGSLGVSNRITAEEARVSFTGGKLLMIESDDKKVSAGAKNAEEYER